jgi:hypothetical protein
VGGAHFTTFRPIGSGQRVPDEQSLEIGQLHVAAAVEIRQERMVESQQVQDGGVQIVNVELVLNSLVAEVVGRQHQLSRSVLPSLTTSTPKEATELGQAEPPFREMLQPEPDQSLGAGDLIAFLSRSWARSRYRQPEKAGDRPRI